MKYFIDRMGPEDTFNIIDFNVSARALFPEPKKNTADTRAKALAYLSTLEANGGTWMGPAIEAVCKRPAPENRLRIVSFMTDGYVGNDFEIISLVKELRGKSRWFPFGTGNSVNRFLLDAMARVGGGEVEYILLNSPGEEVARKFYQRIAEPVLTDITLSMKDVELREVFPESVSDLWAQKPIILKARYTKPGKGIITLKGFSGGKPYKEKIEVILPETESRNPSLSALWARAKVDALMDLNWLGIQRGAPAKEITEEIVKVALAHRIMTQFTSFVAVEETVVTAEGQPVRVTVPVEMPDGVSREGVFGEARQVPAAAAPVAHRESGAMSPYFGGPPRVEEPKARRLLDCLPGVVSRGAPVEQEMFQGARKKAGKARKDAAGVYEADATASHALEKLDADLRALLAAHEQGVPMPQTLPGHAKIIDGKILVQVEVTRASEELLEKLDRLGFRLLFKASTGTALVGTIPVEKLRELAALDEVLSLKPGQVE
jgi:Ca-activated chloride channel homolog